MTMSAYGIVWTYVSSLGVMIRAKRPKRELPTHARGPYHAPPGMHLCALHGDRVRPRRRPSAARAPVPLGRAGTRNRC